jgi:hypothetical protein
MNDFGRRLLGTLFGATMGGVYALVSQYINRILLSGISLYAPPPGLLGSILLTVLLGALIGLLTSWPESSLLGIFLGGLAGAVMMVIATYFNVLGNSQAFGMMYFTVIYTFLPMIVIAMPVSASIRWSMHSLVPVDPSIPINLKKTIWPALVTLAITCLVGGLSLYSGQVRADISQLDAMLQTGLKVSTAATLPKPLQTVNGFLVNAQGSYSFEWADGPDAFQGARPATASDLGQGTVTVRFKNGFTFVCLFIPKASNPVCEAH